MTPSEPTERQSHDAEQEKEINWNDYNYPPLIKLMHFRPSEIPKDKRTIVLMSFAIHIAVLCNTLLNILDNCIEGGLGILYSFLFFFIFNPIVLFLFYRSYAGVCKDKSKLSLFIYIQPLVIIIEIVIAIVDFLGFNGFIRVSDLYSAGNGFEATLGLIVSIIYMCVALLSCYLYFLVFRKRSLLSKAFL